MNEFKKEEEREEGKKTGKQETKAKKLKSRLFVTDIRPGFVNTDMAKGDGLFWVANVEKAAYQIFKAIKQKSSVAYVTKRWLLVAILLKYMPKWIYLKM